MKKRVLLAFFIALTVSFSYAQSDSTAKTRLVLLHPTPLLLDYYKNLTALKLLPDTIEYLGVYHEKEAYDFSKVQHYADSIGFKIRMIPVRGHLGEKDVYTTNSCTPVFSYLFRISSGIIFNGGPDIQPELYGAETFLMTGITDPNRHLFEMSFMFHLIGSTRNPDYSPLLQQKPNYLILGICLGMQTMVAASGGTLIQDIPMEIYKKKTVEQVLSLPHGKQHKNYYKVKYPLSEGVAFGCLHTLSFSNEHAIWKSSGLTKNVQVYSYHHQSAGKLPPSLKAIAWSADKKVIEAVMHITYPNVIGIQFHPEPDFLYLPLKKTYLADGDKMTIGRIIEQDKETRLFLENFWKEISSRLKN